MLFLFLIFFKKPLDFLAVPLYNFGTVLKRGDEMTAKVGRPKSENPKNRKVTVKMTEKEFQTLENVANERQISKSEAILRGIDLLKSEK